MDVVDVKEMSPEWAKELFNTLGTEDITTIFSAGSQEEIWHFSKFLEDFQNVFTYENIKTIEDNFPGFTIGHAEVGTLNGFKIVWDQNASPIGIHISTKNFGKILPLLTNNKTMITITEQLQDILYDKSNLDVSDITEDARLREDLKLDSLDRVEFTIEIEKQFDIRIPDHHMKEWYTFKDVIEYVTQKLNDEDLDTQIP